MSTIDRHLATKLLDHARMCSNAAPSALPRGPHSSYSLAGSLVAETLYCTLLGFLFHHGITGHHEDLPKSLVALARLMEHAGLREFEVFEIEQIAVVDRLHLCGIEKMLLTDSLCQEVFQNSQFVDRLRVELNALVNVGDR